MAQRKHLDDFLRGRIIGRLECGRTQLEVSEELGIAQSVISRLWQRFQDHEPSWHGGILNSCRAASSLVRLVAGDERWEAPDPSPGCSPSKLGWNRAKSHCHLYGAQGYGQRQVYI
ncbi:uncharacterized protein TNCV_717641 [Trichonephila clavipes]|nr:uncharacterized protein TNCV_717641 [Trichonephila clavipes]